MEAVRYLPRTSTIKYVDTREPSIHVYISKPLGGPQTVVGGHAIVFDTATASLYTHEGTSFDTLTKTTLVLPPGTYYATAFIGDIVNASGLTYQFKLGATNIGPIGAQASTAPITVQFTVPATTTLQLVAPAGGGITGADSVSHFNVMRISTHAL